jgi:hypothetical protein
VIKHGGANGAEYAAGAIVKDAIQRVEQVVELLNQSSHVVDRMQCLLSNLLYVGNAGFNPVCKMY